MALDELHAAFIRRVAELEQQLGDKETERWLWASRFNCIALHPVRLPPRAAFANNTEFLKACTSAVDDYMQGVTSGVPPSPQQQEKDNG